MEIVKTLDTKAKWSLATYELDGVTHVYTGWYTGKEPAPIGTWREDNYTNIKLLDPGKNLVIKSKFYYNGFARGRSSVSFKFLPDDVKTNGLDYYFENHYYTMTTSGYEMLMYAVLTGDIIGKVDEKERDSVTFEGLFTFVKQGTEVSMVPY